jgi:hypothetical protein
VLKTIVMAAVAALAAGAATTLVLGVSKVKAGAPVASAAPVAPPETRKVEAAAAPKTEAATCSQAWPNYEPQCMSDSTRPAGEARKVRIITPDRPARRP